MALFQVVFEPGEYKEVTGTGTWRIGGLRNHRNAFFLPTIHWWRLPFDRGRCRGAASKCVQCLVAHVPPFFSVFQGLPDKKYDWQFVLVAQIPFGRSPDCQKKKSASIWFWICSFSLSWDGESLQCATPDFFSGSYSKIPDSSPVITRLKNCGSLSRRSRKSRHTSLRLAFYSVVRFFGTILAHTILMSKSCVKIWWTVNRFKFNSLLIILNVNRRSGLTGDLTLSTLSSVFEVEVLPARCSSSTCSRSSKKDLCHLNTCAWIENVLHKPFVLFTSHSSGFAKLYTKFDGTTLLKICRFIFLTHLTNTSSLQTLSTIA